MDCARSTARTEETTYVLKAITALNDIYIVLLFVWHTRRPCKTRDEKRTVLARAAAAAVVVAQHGAFDVVKRGDDDDDAGRSRSDARPRSSTAFAAEERD